jgi:hypothetical protein
MQVIVSMLPSHMQSLILPLAPRVCIWPSNERTSRQLPRNPQALAVSQSMQALHPKRPRLLPDEKASQHPQVQMWS